MKKTIDKWEKLLSLYVFFVFFSRYAFQTLILVQVTTNVSPSTFRPMAIYGNMSLRHRKKRSWDKIDVDAENKFVRDSNSATSFENMILSYFVNAYGDLFSN